MNFCSFNPDLRANLSFFLLVRMNNLDLASCEVVMVIFAAHIMLAAINEGLPVLNLQAKR